MNHLSRSARFTAAAATAHRGCHHRILRRQQLRLSRSAASSPPVAVDARNDNNHHNDAGSSGSDHRERATTVAAVFVFHRHGDRTPGVSLVGEEFADAEAAFWRTRLPPRSKREALAERFPVRKEASSASSSFEDTAGGNDAYGYLTRKGMDQMRAAGVSAAHRYGTAPADGSHRGGVSSTATLPPSKPFLRREDWDIRAVSTNYLRTVLSCQAFLDGLVSTGAAPGSEDPPPAGEDDEARGGDGFGSRPDDGGGVDRGIPVVVRDPAREVLNAFSTSPALMKRLVADVAATSGFVADDRLARTLARELSGVMPGLAKTSPYAATAPSTDDGGGAAEKAVAINWVHAADHFVCRTAHGVPADRFHPERTAGVPDEERFRALGKATLSHLRRRFRSYYSHPPLLGEMTGPVLREVCGVMRAVADAEATTTTKKKPFRIYSCHDVTILALLRAIGTTATSRTTPEEGEGDDPGWPGYGTCLTLELVRVASGGEEPDVSAGFSVRAHRSEPPVPPAVVAPVVPVAIFETPSPEGIDLARFEALVEALNASRTTTKA